MKKAEGRPPSFAMEGSPVLERQSSGEDAFQQLLLTFSAAASQGTSTEALIQLFCQATRKFFGVDGTYFWRVVTADELVGAEADGVLAERFRGVRLRTN